MLDQRHVLFIGTSETCGHCKEFKRKTWDGKSGLKSKLLAENKLRIAELNLPHMAAPVPNEYPSDLSNWLNGFPSLILFNASSWNSGNKLEGNMFDGKNIDNKWFVLGTTEPSEANIVKWLNTQLTSNSVFSVKPQVVLVHNGSVYNQPESSSLRYKNYRRTHK